MEIIIKPILTEKMTIQGEKLNRYGFIVDVRANKLQIRNAVEQMYNPLHEGGPSGGPRQQLQEGRCHLEGWRQDRFLQ